MEPEVLIVGAGPTGLVLALTLDRFDVPFKLIEKKARPDDLSKAMLVVPSTLEHYSQLGMVENVLKNGLEPESFVFHGDKKSVEFDFETLRSPLSRYARIFTYPQDEHERFLIQRLEERGHQIHWQTSFESLTQQANEVTVQMQTEGESFTESFTYAVGADGGSSAVRKTLGVSFTGETNEQVFFVADATLANQELQGKTVHFFMTHQQFMLSFPLRNQTTKRLIGILPKELTKNNQLNMNHLAPILQKRLGIKVLKNQWFSTYSIHHRVAEAFKVGNVFLAGDAAHVHSPVGGQGMNAGIADSVNLGWKIAHVLKGKSSKQLLYTYQEERSEFARALVSTTDRAFKAVTADQRLVRQVRSASMPRVVNFVMNKTDRLSDMVFKRLSQMTVQYKNTSLNAEDVRHKLLGSRLPYAGDNMAFTDEMTWHVQVYGEISRDLRSLLEKYGMHYHEIKWEECLKNKGFSKDTAYLIRPDGYIAWISEEQDIASFVVYLRKWCIAPLSFQLS